MISRMRRLVFVGLMFGLVVPVMARYVPNSAAGPNGRIDVGLRGKAAISPSAVFADVGGAGFVTLGGHDSTFAVCSYATSGQLQPAFGEGGCFKGTLPETRFARQLLVGQTGYWLLILDSANDRYYALIRLNGTGQPDTGFGPGGQREHELNCDSSDSVPNCPVPSFAYTQPRPIAASAGGDWPLLAEASGGALFLLASRLSASTTGPGEPQAVVFRLSNSGAPAGRANTGGYYPRGVTAHGDGVLVTHQTNKGYALLRVAGNGAIDTSFAAGSPDGVLVAEWSAAMPLDLIKKPRVANDLGFAFGVHNLEVGLPHFDRNGVKTGYFRAPSFQRILHSPPSFTASDLSVWVWANEKFGRVRGGQWDTGTFGGTGPYTFSGPVDGAAISADLSSLAVILRATIDQPARLAIVATGGSGQPTLVEPAYADNARIPSKATVTGIDGNSLVRFGVQGDGNAVWKRIDFGAQRDLPRISTGVLAAVPNLGVLADLRVSPESPTGTRWVVRAVSSGPFEPIELYVDEPGSGSATRRVDMSAIRAQMPPYAAPTPFANWNLLSLDIDDSGAALALVWYYPAPYAPSNGYRMSLLRWDRATSVNDVYQPRIVWSADQIQGRIMRDASGRLWSGGEQLRRFTAQGELDQNLGQGGLLDLRAPEFGLAFSSGYTKTSVLLHPEGGAWIQHEDRIRYPSVGRVGGSTADFVRIDDAGRIVARASWPIEIEDEAEAMLAGPGGTLLTFWGLPGRDNIRFSGVYRVLKLAADGSLETQYGLRGAEKMEGPASSYFPPAVFPLANQAAAVFMDLDDSLSVLQFESAPAGPTGSTAAVVEFYNSILDHYFMTADTEEISWIEAGGAGPGWSRTSLSFRGYADLANAPGGALSVCRFYGDPKPRTSSPNGRVGPNSHFYTFVGEECDHVYRQDLAWLYEGTRMALFPLLPDKTCPAGQTPVLRAYNNGYEIRNGVWTRNDANHRYSTSPAVMAEMASKGWTLEGPRFCAPN